MNGCIIAKTPIAVDLWRVKHHGTSNFIHFLSHMHSDHTNGLSSSWRKPIYCSEITGKLLKVKLEVDSCLIHALEIGQAHIIPLSAGGTETMTVTLIDANHCPGAVMFLFEGYFGRILYTADFKYTPLMLTYPGLADSPSIDVLYLDNTYNDPRCTWDSFNVSLETIENIITPMINDTNIVIALHNLGKEELLVHIAKKFQRWIVVTPDRFETLQLLELPNVFTTDTDASNIRVVSQVSITWKNLIHWNNLDRETIVIVPTGLFKLSKRRSAYDHPNVYLVPYSCHSSYSQLMEFVAKVRPNKIIPVVKGDGNTCDTSNFESLLSKAKPISYKMPESVKTFQNQLQPTTLSLKTKCKSSSRFVRKQATKRKVPQGVIFEEDEEQPVSDSRLSEDAECHTHVLPEKKFKHSSFSIRSVQINEENSAKELKETKHWQNIFKEKPKLGTCDELCESKSLEIKSVLTLRNDHCKRLGINNSNKMKTGTLQCDRSNDNNTNLSVSKTKEMKKVIIPVKNRLNFYEAFERMLKKSKKNR